MGLLVNMGLDRVEVERIVYAPPETSWTENWQSWTDRIGRDDRTTGLTIRNGLRAVYDEHATGYGEAALTKLVALALRQRKLTIAANPVAKATYHGRAIHESALACILVNERIVLTLSALFDSNDFNVNRCRSYLKALGLRWGIAADFGKTCAEVIGIRNGS